MTIDSAPGRDPAAPVPVPVHERPHRRWRSRALAAAALVGLIAAAAAAPIPAIAHGAAPAGAPIIVVPSGRAAYQPVMPCRLIDTRDASAAARSTVDGSTLRIPVTRLCGVAPTATAVAVSVAVTNTTADGFAAITPAGVAGQSSTINWVAGETRSASTVVAVSSDGAIDVHVSSGLAASAVIVDVTGAWTPVPTTSTAGRLITADTRRVLDTRLRPSRVTAGTTVTIDRATLAVPVDAIAVSGTLTSTGGAHAGYLTAFPAGTAVPLASNVNTDAAAQDRAAGVIVALGANGLSIYAGAATTDILFDVTGYVTGASAASSTAGLLVPLSPTRVLDTRTTAEPLTTSTIADIVGALGAPDIGGVIATITSTDSAAAGFAAAEAVGPSRPVGRAADATSVLNWPSGGAVAAMMVQSLTTDGRLAITTSAATALVVDATAYLLGAGATSNGPVGSGGLIVDATSATTAPAKTAPSAGTPTGPRILTTGVIEDRTGTGKATGDPVTLLRQTYTSAELTAGGGISIVFSDVPGGSPAMVPYSAKAFPACGPQPMCVLISPNYWANPTADPVNSNRVMISHEWGHVLSFRYQQYLQGDELAHWIDSETAVNEECLADAVAAMVLARAGWPGNETADYVVHYMCDEYWADRYGADRVAEMRAKAGTVAAGLLQWAGTWGAAHPG